MGKRNGFMLKAAFSIDLPATSSDLQKRNIYQVKHILTFMRPLHFFASGSNCNCRLLKFFIKKEPVMEAHTSIL